MPLAIIEFCYIIQIHRPTILTSDMKNAFIISAVFSAGILYGCSDLHQPEKHQRMLTLDGHAGVGLAALEFLAKTYADEAIIDKTGFEISDAGPTYVRHRIPVKPAKEVNTVLFCFDIVSASENGALGIRLDFENSRATIVADWKTQRIEARKNPAFETDAFFTPTGICGAIILNDLDTLKEASFYPSIGFNSGFPGFKVEAAGKAKVSQYVIAGISK